MQGVKCKVCTRLDDTGWYLQECIGLYSEWIYKLSTKVFISLTLHRPDCTFLDGQCRPKWTFLAGRHQPTAVFYKLTLTIDFNKEAK